VLLAQSNAEITISVNGKGAPVSDQTAACLYFLAPLALLWTAFMVVEGRKILVAIRAGRRGRR
jgi:hypothetical protein